MPAGYVPLPRSGVRAYLAEVSIAAWIVLATFLMVVTAWVGGSLLLGDRDGQGGQPLWLKLDTVELQMADGKMLSIDLGLSLDKLESDKVLETYKRAMAAVIEKQGQKKVRQDFAEPQGIVEFGQQLKRSLNRYLAEHGLETRIKSVEFQQFVLLPDR